MTCLSQHQTEEIKETTAAALTLSDLTQHAESLPVVDDQMLDAYKPLLSIDHQRLPLEFFTLPTQREYQPPHRFAIINTSRKKPSSDAARDGSSVKRKYSTHAHIPFEQRTAGFHYPQELRDQSPTRFIENGEKKVVYKDSRRHCRVCSKKCRYSCVVCDAHLCISGTKLQNCFYRFHTIELFEEYAKTATDSK